jgi:hypothetical protein
MKRISVIALTIAALFAMMAVLASGASAAKKPTNLTLKTAKGELASGANIKAESTNLVFTTSAGNLECSKNSIEGKVGSNSTKKDKGEIETESSTGSETVEGKSGACKTTTPLGSTIITTSHLPWEAIFTDKGVNEVKGKKVSFTSHFSGGIECTFEASKVKSTFNIGGATTITTSKQKFKLAKGSNAACPKEGTLTGTWAVTSGGETVESELT